MIDKWVKRRVQWLLSRFTSKHVDMKMLKADEQPGEQLVTIHGTGKSKHLPKDSEHQVNQAMADHLIEAGRAKLPGTKEKKEDKEQKEAKEKNHKAGPGK